jgi:glycosyltransferase involved in cell wall biosynthesis
MQHQHPPIVSVIIPSYNCEAYIEETVRSVLNQTYKRVEIIVVDDGSTDRTCDLVKKLRSPQVRLLKQKNAGVCAARNAGFMAAHGDFICFLDHDDYWYPEKLSAQVLAMKNRPWVGVVYSNFTLWHRKNGVFPPPSELASKMDPREVDEDGSGHIYDRFLLDCYMLTSTAMFRRQVLLDCGLFDESLPYSEDWDLWLRISRKHTFLKLKRAMTLYRQHPNQGNRKVRPVDYRTNLLIKAVKKWGLCNAAGVCLSRKRFYSRLAAYHADYGLHHLREGHIVAATKALWKAWKTYPWRIKYPAYVVAGMAGWRPKW